MIYLKNVEANGGRLSGRRQPVLIAECPLVPAIGLCTGFGLCCMAIAGPVHIPSWTLGGECSRVASSIGGFFAKERGTLMAQRRD